MHQDWRDRAACLGDELLLDDAIDRGPRRKVAEGKALRICKRDCWVRRECLLDALRVDDQFAIRGGTTARQRRRLRKARAHPGPAAVVR